MQKSEQSSSHKNTIFEPHFERLFAAFAILFYAFVSAQTVRNLPRIPIKAHPALLRSLLSGSLQGYLVPASELESFKKFLPPRGKITFLMDHPFGANQDEEKFTYDAQNYLAPLILNPDPVEKIGILYCPGRTEAAKRLLETQYEWRVPLGDGKGIIQKRS